MPATTDPQNLSSVFKAYDVRGTVPDQVDEALARSCLLYTSDAADE